MANKTYLELVNDILIRLRENEVSSVSDTSYSKMIGKFVNDAKRKVEDAYNWNCLKSTITVNTVASTYNYTLTGIGTRFKVIDVLDDTTNKPMVLAPTQWINQQYTLSTAEAPPYYYNFSGVDANNDTKVNFYPIPDSVYAINFDVIKPQADLSSDSDVILVPSEPVIFLAYAKAIVERGEDGGMLSSEAYAQHQQSLADHIAIEASHNDEDTLWSAY